LSLLDPPATTRLSERVDYYFDVFLQSHKKIKISEYLKEIDRYNACIHDDSRRGERTFFKDVTRSHPEFESLFQKHRKEKSNHKPDLVQHLIDHSEFLNKEKNVWIKSVMEVVRNTSIFFQPQIRTKIMNEGWASYWHEKLFLKDDRIKGHEVDFARAHAGVTSLPRVGLNPYALGMRLFYYIEELGDKGKYSIKFRRLLDADQRRDYDTQSGQGRELIFKIARNFCDFTFITTFVDQDFVNRNNLFVVGKRLNKNKMVWEYYVKSRKVKDYRQMLLDGLYHPPHISIEEDNSKNNHLYLNHHFEGKPLVKDFIANTMLGIEYLWGGPVKLETSEVVSVGPEAGASQQEEPHKIEVKWERVRYTMKERKLSREVIAQEKQTEAAA
jgi:stage V sporulation protein R